MAENEFTFQIQFLQKAYNNFTLHTSCSFRETPLLPLDKSATTMAKIYCLNNYEISIIQHRFLFYWIKHTDTPFITSEYLLQTLGVRNKDIYQLILDVYYNRIDYNIFFIFFCIMTFSQIERIIKLVLSACGIHSNYGVGKDAAESFFTKISETAMFNVGVVEFLSHSDDLITIKDLVTFIESNGELYSLFWEMRINLVKNFFNERYFINIIKRIACYDKSFVKNTDIPKESCTSKLYRILILKEPPPYYTEYRNSTTNPRECDELFNLFILERRKKYGYSKRIGHSISRSHISDTFNDRKSSYHSNPKSSNKTNVSIPKKSMISINQTT